MTASDERLVELPGAGIRLRHPATTGRGHPIELDEVKLHVRSRGGDDLYLEVSRERRVTAAERYEREAAFVCERLGATVGPLEPTTFAGRPAMRYAFRWQEHERVVHLVAIDEWLYRVVHDPAAPLAPAVLATIELG